jgi:hypothetical protein
MKTRSIIKALRNFKELSRSVTLETQYSYTPKAMQTVYKPHVIYEELLNECLHEWGSSGQ